MGLFSEKPDKLTLPGGKELACVVCGFDEFYARKAQLNTAGLTFLNLDWLNESAQCHVCARCSYIHWFLGRS